MSPTVFLEFVSVYVTDMVPIYIKLIVERRSNSAPHLSDRHYTPRGGDRMSRGLLLASLCGSLSLRGTVQEKRLWHVVKTSALKPVGFSQFNCRPPAKPLSST